MAKGLILIPARFGRSDISRNRLLLQSLADYFNFNLQYIEDGYKSKNMKSSAPFPAKPNIPKDIDVIITFSIPQHTYPMIDVCDEILNLPASVKVIGYMQDLQCYGRQICEEYMLKMFDRFDRILAGFNEAFKNLYPQYVDKHVWVPWYFGPHDRFLKLLFNEKPVPKCLMIGAMSKAYPLRYFIYENHKNYGKYVDCKPRVPFDSYVTLLNSYFCCIGTPGFMQSHVAKTIEIPATGSLLMSQTTQDILDLGFKPYEHYIPITQEDVFEQIKKCVINYKDYTKIRKRARNYVIDNYSIKNRFEQIKNVIKEVLKEGGLEK